MLFEFNSQLVLDLIFFIFQLAILIFFGYLLNLIVKALRKYINSKPAREGRKVTVTKISEKLKVARLDKKMTQEFVAETLGVSRQTLYKWEKGTSEPSMSHLVELSKLYEIELQDLL